MRILYVLTTLGIGGAEKQVVALAERMSGRGHTLAFLVLKHSAKEWPVELPVMRMNMRKSPLGLLRALRFARGFAALFRPDIVHSHTFPANLFSRLLRLAWRGPIAAPAIVNTIHNVYEGGWQRMALYRLTDPLCDRVTAVSAAAAARYAQLRAVRREKLSVLTNGIDTAEFEPDRTRRKQVRAQMRAGESFIWLAVGRLAPAKDYPNLMSAFALVRAARPDAELWIAGDGDRSSLGFSYRDDAAAADNSAVRLLGLREDVAGLLDASDGFVLSSAWEGMPLAVGEAMSMEKPVVATDVGGVRELVAEAGLLVPARDSAALAEAMLKAMDREASARRFLGKIARARIETHFSIDAKAREWQALYERSMAKGRS